MTVLLLSLYAALAVVAPGRERLAVCHVTPEDGAVEILVDAAALAVHVGHGDFLPLAGSCTLPATLVRCGGAEATPCPAGSECFDLPGDSCDPACGGTECPGLCVSVPAVPVRLRCGGTAAGSCPRGTTCLDDPSDDCSAACGDSGCAGTCGVPLQEM